MQSDFILINAFLTKQKKKAHQVTQIGTFLLSKMKFCLTLLVCVWLCVCSGIQNGVKQPTNKIKIQHNNTLVPNPNVQWSPSECSTCWDSAYYTLDVLVP